MFPPDQVLHYSVLSSYISELTSIFCSCSFWHPFNFTLHSIWKINSLFNGDLMDNIILFISFSCFECLLQKASVLRRRTPADVGGKMSDLPLQVFWGKKWVHRNLLSPMVQFPVALWSFRQAVRPYADRLHNQVFFYLRAFRSCWLLSPNPRPKWRSIGVEVELDRRSGLSWGKWTVHLTNHGLTHSLSPCEHWFSLVFKIRILGRVHVCTCP